MHEEPFIAKNSSFWLDSIEDLFGLKQGIEIVLTGYSYYPEMEWDQYGFRPPEGLPFFGAWRNDDRTAFIYLVGETRKRPKGESERVLLLISAKGEARLSQISERLTPLTHQFRSVERKALAVRRQQRSEVDFLERFATKKVAGVYAVITVALAGTSKALNGVPTISTRFEVLNGVYEASVMVVHIVSTFSLILAGAYLTIFFARHLLGIVRR